MKTNSATANLLRSVTSAPGTTRRLAPGVRPAQLALLASFSALTLLASGCQVLTYQGPNGERFTRGSFGANTSLASLTVEAGTNGLRRVELQGYQTESTQALSTVTAAAVSAAVKSAK